HLEDLVAADRVFVVTQMTRIKGINEQRLAFATGQQPTPPPATPQAPVAPKPAPNAPTQAAAFAAFAPFVRTRWDQKWLYVESDGLPHAPFTYPLMVGIRSWQQQVPLPQAYTGSNAWQIPLKPELAEKPVSGKTQLYRGAVALAANGVPIFNALNNRGDDAYKAGELDEYGGHSGRGDDYHYHIAPLGLQKVVGPNAPIGYALDGFPLYGLFEPSAKKGQEKSCPLDGTEKLDELNGHFGVNADDSRGLYHYHCSLDYPYINGGVRGKVNVVDDQIDPQPRANPIREALTPLRGAKITGYKSTGDASWLLEYMLSGKTHGVAINRELNGSYTFEFINPDGTKTTETYAERRGGGEGRGGGQGGGRRGRGGDQPPPREGQRPRNDGDNRPPPRENERPATPAKDEPKFKQADGFKLSSPAIGADGRLPALFTCDGASQSPPLSWTTPPAGTKCLAIMMHHIPGPGGEPHVYWIISNLPTTTTSIPANDQGAWLRGANTVNGRPEYAPPCSKGPGDKTYTITLYALSAEPKLEQGGKKITRPIMLEAIKDLVIAAAPMDVVYARASESGNKSGNR
ncbi:MAG: YHYH protein, partial [Planctomycetota bacterium]|nr:YHYH protein [Planctomycetota bacterium]